MSLNQISETLSIPKKIKINTEEAMDDLESFQYNLNEIWQYERKKKKAEKPRDLTKDSCYSICLKYKRRKEPGNF